MMPLMPGSAAPDGGFEVPLEMLQACHRRVERQCSTLQRLAAHVAAHGVDADASSAAAAVLRYFDTAARDHHADEEEDLFPALMESMAGSDPVCIREMAQHLSAEHRQLEAAWSGLRPRLQAIAAGQALALPADAVQAFGTLYAAHIAFEERELLPMAARLLDDDALAMLGRAMRQRRGIAAVD
jgi:hemerythrin-like domain-containing protein